MKKQLFIFSLLLLFDFSGRAQNTIARIKYEAAEEAFDKENYALALEKIEETEKLLKNVNPKTLYLKIMAKYHLMKDDYAIIKSLKTDCKYYLDEYESNEGVQDKYREIYKISRELTVIGDSDEAIKKNNEKVSAEKIKKEKIKNLIFYANELSKKYQYIPGLSYDDFKAQNEYLRNAKLKRFDNGDFWGMPTISYTQNGSPFKDAFPGAIVNSDDMVIHYSVNYAWGKNLYETHLSMFNDLRKSICKEFDKKYIDEQTTKYGVQKMIIKVPKSAEDDTINYYIIYSFSSYDSSSILSIAFTTNEKIVNY